jgi:hypothetical protein
MVKRKSLGASLASYQKLSKANYINYEMENKAVESLMHQLVVL